MFEQSCITRNALLELLMHGHYSIFNFSSLQTMNGLLRKVQNQSH